jgi:hypothetical protein
MTNSSQVVSQESRTAIAPQHQQKDTPYSGQDTHRELVIEVLTAPSTRPAVFTLCYANNSAA